MYIRKVKRKCNVRGCRCTDSYAISLVREVGNSVIICKSCLAQGLAAIEAVEEPVLPKADAPVEEPVLPKADAPVEEPVLPKADAPVEETTPPSDADFKCPHCGQICKSELGLQKHIAAKHKEQD